MPAGSRAARHHLFSILSLLFLTRTLHAQTGTVTGWVVDDVTDQVLEGVQLTIVGIAQESATDEDGFFLLAAVPSGTHTIALRRIGYHESAIVVEIESGRSIVFAATPLRLPPLPVRLANIEADAGRLGAFFARRAAGRGVFMTGSEIRELHPHTVQDIFQAVPALRMRYAKLGLGAVALQRTRERRARVTCRPSIFINGFPAAPGQAEAIPPDRVIAMEVFLYWTQVPAGYRSPGQDCEVILLWTS